jgi:hypothetical protein
MKIGPSFLKVGKAVLYPLAELEAWDRKKLLICRAIRIQTGKELEVTGSRTGPDYRAQTLIPAYFASPKNTHKVNTVDVESGLVHKYPTRYPT